MTTTDASPTPTAPDADALAASVTKQGSLVRQLKKDGAAPTDVAAAVEELQRLKIASAAAREAEEDADPSAAFPKKAFDELILRKMFVVPSFEIHGGVKGLFDLGPPACALKAAIVDVWRKHFVLAENMLEMECTCLTPQNVLKTSGHVERFTDLMVRDPETGECFRADKLLEEAIDRLLEDDKKKDVRLTEEQTEAHLRVQRQADAYSSTELDALLTEYDCSAPSGKPYSASFPFNLMFKTSIGPEGTAVGYLRPETAQGLFVNFRRMLDMNAGKMPFAAAQIGLGFRNEIAPRSGLLRVREFCMGEIEHFVNPDDKDHPKFGTVQNVELVLFGRDDQLGSGKTRTVKVGDAVASGLVNNQTLAYFMARTKLFMDKIGMDPDRLRFRQHLQTEMAHYATDCWDLEIHTSHGWVECVGHADRACYDLTEHAKATKTSMTATVKLAQPRDVDVAKIKLNRKELGKTFKQDQRVVSRAIEDMAERWEDFEREILRPLEDTGAAVVRGPDDDKEFTVTKDMIVEHKKLTKKVHELKFTPSVVEPSFGMGRVLHALLEHSFSRRASDEQRCVMSFVPRVAPYKCAVLPLSARDDLNVVVDRIAAELGADETSVRVDKSTAALGRRYARADEIGVPFAVTVDFATVEDDTVTLRERDSMVQVRLPAAEVATTVRDMVSGRTSWDDASRKWPVVQVNEDE